MPSYTVVYYAGNRQHRRPFTAASSAAARLRYVEIVARLQNTSRHCRDFRLEGAGGKLLAGAHPSERRWPSKQQETLPLEK